MRRVRGTWTPLALLAGLALVGVGIGVSGCGLLPQDEFPVEIRASTTVGRPPLYIRFAARVPPGADALEPIAYRWDFGDGGRAQGAAVDHRYRAAGFYRVRLTAMDGRGRLGTARVEVEVIDFGRVDLPAAQGLSVLSTGDFNADGLADLVRVDSLRGRLTVFLGRADGGFDQMMPILTGRTPSAAQAADADRDGRLDLLIANRVDSTVALYLGNGDGTFKDPQVFPIFLDNFHVASDPLALMVGDFTGDGAVDAATANRTTDNVSVFLGDGTGRLRLSQDFPAPRRGLLTDGAAAELNGDGLDDLLLLDEAHNQVYVFFSRGDGTFDFRYALPTGERPQRLSARDLDGDGLIDVAIADAGGDVSLWRGQGDGLFAFPARLTTGGTPVAIATGDFDGRWGLDVAVAVADPSSGRVLLLLAREDGFSTPVAFEVGPQPQALTAADFDGDGQVDLAVSDADGTLSVLFNLMP